MRTSRGAVVHGPSRRTLADVSVQVHLLGEARILDATRGRRPQVDRRLGLLAYLACADGAVDRDELATLFWTDVTTTRARTNLRSLLARVRRLPYAAAVESDRERVGWDVDCDVPRFRRAVAEQAWETAVDSYRGYLLAGASFDGVGDFGGWVEGERARLQGAFRRSAMARADELVGCGEVDAAVALLERLLGDDPYDEEVIRLAVAALASAGQVERGLRLGRAFEERVAELGVAPSLDVERLVRDATTVEPPATTSGRVATPTAGGWSPVPLPVALTRFVGRVRERGEVAARLARPDCRLLTLTGPGGVGKTRLALQVTADVEERYRDGAHFVSLASASTALDVAVAIAGGLGVRLAGDAEAEARLAELLAPRQALLVLDDLDGALAAAPLLIHALAASPGVDLMVTSRERLGFAEEWLVRVAGLDHPAEGSTSAAARATDAVEMFVDGALRVDPDFRAQGDTLLDVVRICRLVEGLPLGIELAAAAVRSIPVRELARELTGSLELLGRAPRGGDPRHGSVRAAFAGSWTRLEPVEAETLASLGVFHGGFRREAASEVVGATLPTLAALVDKSLLRLSHDGRYSAHPLVEQFTREKLKERPERALDVERRHREHFEVWARIMGERFERHADPRIGERMAEEYPNLLAAIDAAAIAGDADAAARIVSSLTWFWAWHGRLREGRARLERVLALDFQEESVALALLLNAYAIVLMSQGEVALALEHEERSARIVLRHDAPDARVRSLRATGAHLVHRGRHDEAMARFEEGLASAVGEEHTLTRIFLLCDVGALACRAGDERRARETLGEAMRLARRDGNGKLAGVVHSHLGRLERRIGALRAAREHLDAAVVELRASRHAGLTGSGLLYRALLALEEEDAEAARVLLAEALTLWWEAGMLGRIGDVFRAAAALHADLGDAAACGRFAAFAEATAPSTVRMLHPTELDALDAAIARCRARDKRGFAAGAAEAAGATREQMVARTREGLEDGTGSAFGG